MKHSARFVMSLLMFGVVFGAACTTPPDRESEGIRANGETRSEWLRTELYFAIGGWAETALSTEAEARWAEFLDREVTPRFPAGLSVIDIYGQWKESSPEAPILRERSRLLVIVHPKTAEANEKLEAIRQAWKTAQGETSVLRVTQPAEVRF